MSSWSEHAKRCKYLITKYTLVSRRMSSAGQYLNIIKGQLKIRHILELKVQKTKQKARPLVHLPLSGSSLVSYLTIASQVVELHKFMNDLIALSLGNTFWYTHMQMVLHNQFFQLLNGLTNCICLSQDVYTVLVVFNH